jgi:predicted nucleic acid-binding protein
MKFLVDTCIWSLALRRRNASRMSPEDRRLVSELRDGIQASNAAIIGPVRQEVLSGIRDHAQFTKTQGLLEPFPDEELQSADFIESARLFNVCQDHGVVCGAVDILICAVAARLGYGILTNDSGLARCAEVLRAEGKLL